MKKLLNLATLGLALYPVAAFAQLPGTGLLIVRVGYLVNVLIGIVAAIALLVFFWGLAKFIFNVGGDEKAVGDGKRLMIWGTIALFVMVSIWGLVRFISQEIGVLPSNNPPALPTVPKP